MSFMNEKSTKEQHKDLHLLQRKSLRKAFFNEGKNAHYFDTILPYVFGRYNLNIKRGVQGEGRSEKWAGN